jgi:2',3'-cyclic-nucleotide 2'-phosphodiesterase (5'-nucleotidase family)
VARRATGIKQVRSQNPHVLVLDAGNALTGQLLADQSRGLAVVEAMNLMGYDALALGPLELQLSESELRTVIAQARFPVLSANVVVPGTGELFAKPYVVVEVGGHRVGLVGLTRLQSAHPTLRVTDPLAAAREYVPRAAQEAGLVVVLSNAGAEVNQQIAAQVPGIAVLVNAGTRTPPEQPQVIQPTRTLLVGAGYEGIWVGVLRLQLDKASAITGYTGEQLTLDRRVADDPELAALVNRYKVQFNIPTPTGTR